MSLTAESGTTALLELGVDQETMAAQFNAIVEQLEGLGTTAPEAMAEVAAQPLQKNTGMSDKPKAWR